MPKLDEEEARLLESVERGEWKSAEDVRGQIDSYKQYARATFKKERRINIRLSSRDLEAIQTIAFEEGLPYQTLIASVLHKFATGRLVKPDPRDSGVVRRQPE